MTQLALVMNPAKVDDPDALTAALVARLAAAGWPKPIVAETTEQDPGQGMAERAMRAGAQVVLAAGGDGTVAAVVSALAGTGTALAVLPSGTGNLLARNLDLPTDLEAVLATILGGRTWTMDVGEVLDGPGAGGCFAVMAGLGFDAAVVGDAPDGLKSGVGWPAYLVSALGHLTDEPFDCTIILDGGEPLERTARTVLVANTAGLQGGLDLAPDAGVTDGLLDVIVVSPQNAIDWLRIGARLVAGSDREDERLERFQAARVEITTESDQVCQLDGDAVGPTRRLVAEVRPRALTLCGAGTGEG